MKGREGRGGAPSADLLVCFPSRAHLTLMPKPLCSPARPNEPNKRSHNNHHHHYHHHLKKSINRGGGGSAGAGQGQASPWLWSKNKQMGSEMISEPTSPKVTCAGQIKVRPKPNSIKNWQSVMEEIEKLHTTRKHKKKPTWVETLGIKKDVMQFLACLRRIRFDFRCFGSFPTSEITSDDEDEDEDEDEEDHVGMDGRDEASRTVFSKWFMVLQENQNNGITKEATNKGKYFNEECADNNKINIAPPCAPPSNALLLMRCRSAPAKSWLEEREDEEDDEEDEDEEREREEEKKTKLEMEKDMRKKKENLVVMRYETDFNKLSSDIAKETWVVGGIRDPLSRSRSWKR